MKTYFKYEETGHGWMIAPVYENFISSQTDIRGSLNLLPCRISGLSWAKWLQYCRNNGAILIGKNCLYVVAMWKEPNMEFINALNMRANELAKFINLKELSL